jgi:hypothetical protein
VDGGGGNDYLGGDLGPPQYSQRGTPGIDGLDGGAGDDWLDGRDGPSKLTPTDHLTCGDGTDAVIGRQDDLADGDCESSVQGVFTGELYFEQQVYEKTFAGLQPVARGADGAPTYRIGCSGGFQGDVDCQAQVQLQTPPAKGEKSAALGESDIVLIPAKSTVDVTVKLNAAGTQALAVPGARASVLVLMGGRVGDTPTGEDGEFGWQQVLGPQ